MKFGLSEETFTAITNVFDSFPEVESVILYGSRAKGNFQNGSDLDLTLKGGKLNQHTLNKLSLALDDLYLPYTFDLSIFHHIHNTELLDHIERVGKVIFEREKVIL